MTDRASAQDLNALDALLDAERAALLSGEIEDVGRLAGEKEDLLARLGGDRQISVETMRRLQTKISQNQSLFENALDGIRAAAARIEDMRRVRQVLNTYDRRGLMREIKLKGGGTVERRA